MPNTEKGTNEQSSFRSADKDVKTRVPKKDSKYRGSNQGSNGQSTPSKYRSSK